MSPSSSAIGSELEDELLLELLELLEELLDELELDDPELLELLLLEEPELDDELLSSGSSGSSLPDESSLQLPVG